MDSKDIAKQTQIEREMLGHIEQAMRVALSWAVEQEDFSRNLSTLRFVVQSFQRHLKRGWALQQHGGYLKAVLEIKPHLDPTVKAMNRNHNRLEDRLDNICFQLERVSPSDHATFAELREDLLGFLDDLREHHAQENQLYLEAFTQEEGGEA